MITKIRDHKDNLVRNLIRYTLSQSPDLRYIHKKPQRSRQAALSTNHGLSPREEASQMFDLYIDTNASKQVCSADGRASWSRWRVLQLQGGIVERLCSWEDSDLGKQESLGILLADERVAVQWSLMTVHALGRIKCFLVGRSRAKFRKFFKIMGRGDR